MPDDLGVGIITSPFSPASGPATGSFKGLHPKSKFLAIKGPWGIPDRVGGNTDVENAAHGFVTFKLGQVLSLQVSWAEMIKREEVSVVFQGTKAGGKVERLFSRDGLDETAIDTCELFCKKMATA